MTDCALECERLVENEPDSDHLDQNSPVAERVAERCQPEVNLKTIEIIIIIIIIISAIKPLLKVQVYPTLQSTAAKSLLVVGMTNVMTLR